MSADVTRWATLTRGRSSPQGVMGDLATDKGTKYKSCERPWVDNLRSVSCVPVGRYLCVWMWSEKHEKFLYHLVDVPNRDVIELHSANVFEQLLGCIALGKAVAQFKAGTLPHGLPTLDCQGVTDSAATMDRFHTDMRGPDGKQQSFWLTIV